MSHFHHSYTPKSTWGVSGASVFTAIASESEFAVSGCPMSVCPVSGCPVEPVSDDGWPDVDTLGLNLSELSTNEDSREVPRLHGDVGTNPDGRESSINCNFRKNKLK